MNAANLHDDLFAAIEQRYAIDADLLQLAGKPFIDFAPQKDEEGNEQVYPLVAVMQGEEGGSTEPGPGGKPVYESFAIRFEVVAATRSQASQIIWQIVRNFSGDASNDEWTGDYPGVTIIGCSRFAPPVVTQVAQGECEASVSFSVMASPNDTVQE